MKLLFIHADHLDFEARRPAVKGLPPLAPDAARGEADEALVVFFSVERGDLADPPSLVSRAVENVKDVLDQVKAERVVLYPYAHLSQDLAPPREAQHLGEALRDRLSATLSVPVLSAPFGYYKAFTLKAKGHPLAELSRTLLGGAGGPASPEPSPHPGGAA
ncbi:Threonyl-tRNA synthetase, editing region, archaea domain protein, partial [mine drainage metagenome]